MRLSDFAVELAARLEGQVPASRIEQITEVLNSAILNEDLLAARLDQYIAIGIPRHEHETMTTLEQATLNVLGLDSGPSLPRPRPAVKRRQGRVAQAQPRPQRVPPASATEADVLVRNPAFYESPEKDHRRLPAGDWRWAEWARSGSKHPTALDGQPVSHCP